MTVDWTKLIPEDPSVEMIEALDEVIHDHFAGRATEITNQGVEAMVEFIRTEIDGSDGSELNVIFHREYAGQQDFYFLVPRPHQGWSHWTGAAEPIDFCLMIYRQDRTQPPIILGACTVGDRRHLDDAEWNKELFLDTLEQFPAWREDPQAWNWIRHEHVAEIPSVWWPAHREFFDNRAEQRMEARMASASVDAPNQEV